MRKLIIFLLLGISVSVWAQNYEQLISQAQQALENKQFVKAKNYFYKATMLKQSPEAYVGLGRCYLALKQTDSAMAALKKAYLLNPSNPEANYYLGLAYFTEQADATNALKYFKRALQLSPDSMNYAVYVGLAYQAKGEIDSAFSIYKKIMQKDTTNPYPYYFLADYMYENDSLYAAYKLINKAIAKNPNNYNFYLLKASIEFKAHLYQNALKTAEKGLKINPDSYKLLLIKASCLYQLQQYNEAIAILEKLLLRNPDNLNVYFYLAWSYYYTAQYSKAEDIARDALKKGKQIPEFYQILAYTYIAEGEYIKAQKAADKMLEISPSQVAYNLKVTATLYARTPKQVLTSDHKFIKLNALNLPYIKEELNNPQSNYYYEKLKSKFATNPDRLSLDEYLMVYLGYALHDTISRDKKQEYVKSYRAGKYQLCIEQAKAAISRYPFEQNAYLYMASAYRQLGDIANFIKYLTVYHGLMKAIVSSGDGMTAKTAYLVTNKQDIYYVVGYSMGSLQKALSFGMSSQIEGGYEVYKVTVSFTPKVENNVYFLLFK